MQRNPKLWKKRPLSQELIDYAVGDVSHLLSLADKLTVELGKSQLLLLARLSQKYSQWFWLTADRTKSRGSDAENASMVCLYLYFALGSSRSWLTHLFISDEGDDATYRADVEETSSEEEQEEEDEEDVYQSEEEDYNRSYHYSSSEDEISSDDDYWD